MSLQGKRIVVTGGSKGIGKSVVYECLRRNAALVLTCARGEGDLAQLQKDVREELGEEDANKLHTVAIDVTRPDGCQQLAHKAKEISNAFDGAVLQAGTNVLNSTTGYSEEDFDFIMGANVKSAYFCAQKLYGILSEAANTLPSIVFMSSVSGEIAHGTGSIYSAAKAGIAHMTSYLACEWYHMRINCVAPGFVRTPLAAGLVENDNFQCDVRQHIPLGRVAEPTEVSRPVCFLLSDDASYITGETLGINGGMKASGYWLSHYYHTSHSGGQHLFAGGTSL